MADQYNSIDSILNERSDDPAARQTDERLRRLWDFPPMRDLLRDYADPFEVKIARRVLDELDTEYVARCLARHLRRQTCEDRDMRLVADTYIASFYVQPDQRRLMLHTDLTTHLTCVLLLPARPSPESLLDPLAR